MIASVSPVITYLNELYYKLFIFKSRESFIVGYNNVLIF